MLLEMTRALIDCGQLAQNVRIIRNSLDEHTMLLAVVKADAYGHGIVNVAQIALENGASWLGVAVASEGVKLRKAGIDAPILIMGSMAFSQIETSLAYNLVATVCDCELLRAIDACAKEKQMQAKVHVKINTGMNRIGIRKPEELIEFLDCLETCKHIELQGAFTHFADAENESDAYSQMQQIRFSQMVSLIRERGLFPILHAANSAATLLFPYCHLDMVRVGLLMYGYVTDSNLEGKIAVQPVMSWRSEVVFVSQIPRGEKIGYNCTYTTTQDSTIATIPVGYGDGYKRLFSNQGYMLIRGEKAPIVGRVCMDQTMVDVTAIPDVVRGDEVMLLGKQQAESLDANLLAKWAQTIPYEILLSISVRVPREYK